MAEPLPHAAALAEELAAEMRRLDSLQQHYTNLLVYQLSSVAFLEEQGDRSDTATALRLTSSQRSTEQRTKSPSTRASARSRHRDAHGLSAKRGESGKPPPLPLPLPPAPPRRTQSLGERSTTTQARKGAGADPADRPALRDVPRRESARASATIRSEEARRAHQALLKLREDRDAYVNAKARRARELLREGQEAVRRSRARRLAAAQSSSPQSAAEAV